MKTATHPVGSVCWADLSTDDIAAARAFYGALFGWESLTAPDELNGYVDFTLGGSEVVGALQVDRPDWTPRWNSYVRVTDIAATTKAVEAAGGSAMLPPMQVLDLGRMAVYLAPDGASIGAWQAGTFHGSQVVREPNTPLWTELTTPDPDGSEAFYAAVFGWTFKPFPTAPGYRQICAPGEAEAFGGLMERPDDYPAAIPAGWTPYFMAADTDATAAKAVELGGTVVSGPGSVPSVGRIAAVQDPTGAVFSLLDPRM